MRRVAAAIGSDAGSNTPAAAAIGEEYGSTTTAVARVVRARRVYLGLATKVNCPGPASAMPAAEVTSASGSPWRVAPRWAARSASFMGRIVERQLPVVSF